MRATAVGLAETLFQGIPTSLWLALWIGTLHNTEFYRSIFMQLYHLQIGTIVGEGGDIEVVQPTEDFVFWWLAASVFVLTPAGACLEGCPLSKRPTP